MIKKYPFKNILTLALLILFTNQARALQKILVYVQKGTVAKGNLPGCLQMRL